MAKNPYFKFYPNDFLGGVAYLSFEERGAYITLLCHQWDSGPIPKKRLGFLLGSGWVTIWESIKDKFEENAEGLIFNERLEDARQQSMRYLNKQRENGEKGGRPKKPKETQPFSNNKPKKNPTDFMTYDLMTNDLKGGMGGKTFQLVPEGQTRFKGMVMEYLQNPPRNYVWANQDDDAIKEIEYKITQILIQENVEVTEESKFESFKMVINNLSEWKDTNRFQLKYINDEWNANYRYARKKIAAKGGAWSESDAKAKELLG